MQTAVNDLVFLIALLHFWFLILEMALWQKPVGLKTFKNSPEKAAVTAVLAANQGLYNGFLGAGLLVSLLFQDVVTAISFQIFFLLCVLIAGVYGAWSFSRRILFIQALPAAIALGCVLKLCHAI